MAGKMKKTAGQMMISALCLIMAMAGLMAKSPIRLEASAEPLTQGSVRRVLTGVHVFASPASDAQITGTIAEGAMVEVERIYGWQGFHDAWVYVRQIGDTRNVSGWVFSAFLGQTGNWTDEMLAPNQTVPQGLGQPQQPSAPHLHEQRTSIGQSDATLLRNVLAVSGRAYYVIREDGSLWGWGNCVQGQRGTHRHIMDGVVSVAAADRGELVMMKDGSVWTDVWRFDYARHASGDPLVNAVILPPVQVIFP